MAKVLGIDLDNLPKWAPFALLGGVGGLVVWAIRPKGNNAGTTYLAPLDGQGSGKVDIDEGALIDTRIGALGEMLTKMNEAQNAMLAAQGQAEQNRWDQLLLILRNNTGAVPGTPTVPGGPVNPPSTPVVPVRPPGGALDPRSPLPADPNAPQPPTPFYTGTHNGNMFIAGRYVGKAANPSTPTPRPPVSTPTVPAPESRMGLLGYLQQGSGPRGNYSWIRYNIPVGNYALLAFAAPWAVGQKIAGWNA